MTVYCYSGVPGSGKSLHIVKELLFRLKHNKHTKVLTNFDVNLEPYNNRLYKFDAFTFTPDTLMDWICEDSPDGILPNSYVIVWDEAQNVFNTRTWNDPIRLSWLKWFTTSRHWGCDVILCAQQMEMLDKQIRGVIEINVRHYKLASVFKLLGALTLWRPIFIWFSSYATNQKMKLQKGIIFGTGNLFDRYDTMTLLLGKSDGTKGIVCQGDNLIMIPDRI